MPPFAMRVVCSTCGRDRMVEADEAALGRSAERALLFERPRRMAQRWCASDQIGCELRQSNTAPCGAGLRSRAQWAPPDKAISKARERAAEANEPIGVPLVPWSLHDLRRTVATGLQRLGVRLEVTEAVLNHVSGIRGGIAGVYQRHDWAEEKRCAGCVGDPCRGDYQQHRTDPERIAFGESARHECQMLRNSTGSPMTLGNVRKLRCPRPQRVVPSRAGAPDYKSGGRRFESFRARHLSICSNKSYSRSNTGKDDPNCSRGHLGDTKPAAAFALGDPVET